MAGHCFGVLEHAADDGAAASQPYDPLLPGTAHNIELQNFLKYKPLGCKTRRSRPNGLVVRQSLGGHLR